ncbi:MAG: hypothetical protein WBL05_13200 [Brooklawnia sp.]
MVNILSRIADAYTDEPDPVPELTFARFVSNLLANRDGFEGADA